MRNESPNQPNITKEYTKDVQNKKEKDVSDIIAKHILLQKALSCVSTDPDITKGRLFDVRGKDKNLHLSSALADILSHHDPFCPSFETIIKSICHEFYINYESIPKYYDIVIPEFKKDVLYYIKNGCKFQEKDVEYLLVCFNIKSQNTDFLTRSGLSEIINTIYNNQAKPVFDIKTPNPPIGEKNIESFVDKLLDQNFNYSNSIAR